MTPEERRRAEKHFRVKVAINVVLVILGSVFIALFLLGMRSHLVLENQRNSCKSALVTAEMNLNDNREYAEELRESFHRGNQAVLDDICILLSREQIDAIAFSGDPSFADLISDILMRSGADVLLLISKDGETLYSSSSVAEKPDPVREGLMTAQELSALLEGTEDPDGAVKPVKTERYDTLGAFFYYSRPYHLRDRSCMLVIGADATQLAEQIEFIRDVPLVLRQENGTNSVITFAIDPKAGAFLFYENGEEVLTGRDIREAGLSDAVLKDGYSGMETINGRRYYCASMVYDENTVLCSAASSSELYAGSGYVLFWSVLAFVLIMAICLAYSVVVRNDFVRHAVVTDKVLLKRTSGKKLYFNKSLFRRVFPLMILSMLALFGISYYVQTMLKLSEAMHRAQEIVKEIPVMYEKNTQNRGVVQGYYDNQFIAQAELIGYLLEVDPSALNEPSEHYHSYYDDKGRRRYSTGEGGTRVKSVSQSGYLQSLCEINHLESVYIYDEEGRTIGTNTPNWFFTISREEGDQSHDFLKVLDGRADSFVQAPMKDDLGEPAQYVGVPFRYYTRKDESGNTVYVSRSQAGEPGVVTHRSMIQIGLNAERSENLQMSTEFTYLLYSFVSDSGYIAMYDYSDEHRCVYSPIQNDVGKTAAELEVPEKAFKSNFYCRIQGFGKAGEVIVYQWSDNYCFETHLLREGVFRSRGLIALITALIAFILLMILLGTVTLTSREEEELYAEVFYRRDRFRWFSGTPEEKLTTMIRVVAAILVVSVLIALQVAEHNADDHSMLRFVMEGAWDRGLNLFAFSKSALILLSVVFAISLLRVPLRLLPSIFGARGETIGHLLFSLVKYGGVLAAVFYSLYLFGINSSELLTSASLLTLIIGFGSQSLIKDIISGLFIVFESEFQVGDIVTIRGFRGIVHDIGLRSTKVLGIDDDTGNLKVFNNSEITEVLNMTYRPSRVVCRIGVEYGQDLAYVEAVMKRELPAIAAANPKIVAGPYYRGVEEFADSSVVVGVYVLCKEIDVKLVSRALNRSVLDIFYRNDIRVPFPNLTISQLETDGRKTIADLDGPEGGEEEK